MSDHPPHVLLVEDDPDTADLIREALADHFGVDAATHAESLAAALSLDPRRFDLVLSDLNLPDGDGLELIDEMLRRRPDLPIVMVTGEKRLATATRAIRRGACDYVVKAGDYLQNVPLIVEKNLAFWKIKRRNLRLQSELERTMEELRSKNKLLQEAVEKLEKQAATDPLTGVANRRHVQTMLEQSFAEAARYGGDLACIMIDLDGFKQFNDEVGHQGGDRLLQGLGRVLRANCRQCDVPGRFGGDEFIVLLPQTSPAHTVGVARRIKEQFKAEGRAAFDHTRATGDLSIGIACLSLSRPAAPEMLIAHADRALYEAKRGGKGRVYLSQGPDHARDVAADQSAA